MARLKRGSIRAATGVQQAINLGTSDYCVGVIPAQAGIEGGQVHRLSKGDVISIPANTPHWWKDTSATGSVGYYAVNIEQ